LRYSDLDDAIARANKTSFGLGASVWSSNPERAAKVAVQLQAGSVWVNDHMVLNVDVPFGGWRESGIGRGNGQVGLISCMETNVVRVFKQKG
jgi:acyl-CoA reductase-like NAD-dependent aldehyde dehydrogenase